MRLTICVCVCVRTWSPLWARSNIVTSHAAGPGSIPGGSISWLRFFPGCKTNVRKLGPHSSPVIIYHPNHIIIRLLTVTVSDHSCSTWPSLTNKNVCTYVYRLCMHACICMYMHRVSWKWWDHRCGLVVTSLPLTKRTRVRSPIGSISWLRFFPWFFLNCKTNVRTFGPHSSPGIISPS